MCQLDRAMGCPDIWFNIILSVEVFLDKIGAWQFVLLSVSGPGGLNRTKRSEEGRADPVYCL